MSLRSNIFGVVVVVGAKVTLLVINENMKDQRRKSTQSQEKTKTKTNCRWR